MFLKKPSIYFLLVAISFSSAQAADYSNLDLSAPVTEVSNYENVTVENNRTLTSGSLTGGYTYFGGNVTGDVNITNNGSITSTHNNYGVFYLPTVGNLSGTSTVSIIPFPTPNNPTT